MSGERVETTLTQKSKDKTETYMDQRILHHNVGKAKFYACGRGVCAWTEVGRVGRREMRVDVKLGWVMLYKKEETTQGDRKV